MFAGIRFGAATIVLVGISLLVYWTCRQYCYIADTSVLDSRVLGFTEVSEHHQPVVLPLRDQLLNGELRDQRALMAVRRSALWWMVLASAVGMALALWWLWRAAPMVPQFRFGKQPRRLTATITLTAVQA